MKHQALIGMTLAFLTITAAQAQDLNGRQITDIIRSLAPAMEAPPAAGSHPVVTKRLLLNNTIIIIDPAYSLDFEVYFPFGSAQIGPQAQKDLKALGKALASSELREHSYLIAGHTDAKGSAAYNLSLSSRRAAAVRQSLLEDFAIDPRRLIAVGFGESQLKTPEAPNAGFNRRVEVVLVLPQ